MKFEPTESQAQLLDKVKVWFRRWESGFHIGDHPQWFSYSGAAGVGKGVSARMIVDMLGLDKNSYVASAYVGKAVLQLRKNGMNAMTIHKLIYDTNIIIDKDKKTGKPITRFEFVLKYRLDKDYRLIFVDEAGMVNDEMVKELLSFGVPIIFMGDMNQLPPVFGFSTVLKNPNHILTQIMRQKEDDPIVQLSQMVLKGIPILEGSYGKSRVIRDLPLDDKILTDYDQIICNTHRYREAINNFVRKSLKHFPEDRPMLGDKVVCSQNNWEIEIDDYALTNGMIGYITNIERQRAHRGYYIIDFAPDFFEPGKEFINLKVDSKYINMPHSEQKNVGRLNYEKFEYGYAITTYKSQGSEFNRVLFFDSFFKDNDHTKRSRYTAITRAREELTIVLDSKVSKMR